MLTAALSKNRSNTLMGEYSSLLGEAVLRRRTREAEHSARIEMETANQIKSEFISNMSHELRTPLNTVIGFAKLLVEHDRRRLPDSDIVEYSKLIHDAATHLLAVINDILDMSKMQSGRFTLDAHEVNVGEVLQDRVASFRRQAEEAGVTVRSNITRPLPPIRGDATKLDQVFSNIISNAIKFTHRNGSVTVEAMPMADGGVVVIVRDTGVGMTPQELDVALTAFGQVDGAKTRWREGTGLGLPIANALVSLHGGEISVRSEKGVGTEVAILLPSRHFVTVAEGRDAVFRNDGM